MQEIITTSNLSQVLADIFGYCFVVFRIGQPRCHAGLRVMVLRQMYTGAARQKCIRFCASTIMHNNNAIILE